MSKIYLGMTTIPTRFFNLPRIISTILPIVDKMFVHVNGSNLIPSILQSDSKIIITSSEDNKGSGMKFNGVQTLLDKGETDFYYFTQDDDLLIKPAYVEFMTKKMQELKNKVILCSFAHWYSLESEKGIFGRLQNVMPGGVRKRLRVMYAGTGTAVFHYPEFHFVPSDNTYAINMDDEMFGIKASKLKVPVYAIEQNNENNLFLEWLHNGGTRIWGTDPIQQIERAVADNIDHLRITFDEMLKENNWKYNKGIWKYD